MNAQHRYRGGGHRDKTQSFSIREWIMKQRRQGVVWLTSCGSTYLHTHTQTHTQTHTDLPEPPLVIALGILGHNFLFLSACGNRFITLTFKRRRHRKEILH